MAKAYMADADIIHKSVRGHADQVRPCTRCDWCGTANNYGTSMRCAINPLLGKELDLTSLVKPGHEQKVMVIGGGPGGMMAAQTLSAMGHHVDLYEKSDRLGGLLNDATVAPFKEYLRLYKEWDIRQTEACGATLHFNTEVTADFVRQQEPDAIIVATGSQYIKPPVPGVDGPNVRTVKDVEHHTVPVGQNVIICGGGVVGLECAIMLGMEGKSVTVIDMIPEKEFGKALAVFNHIEVMYQLEKYGVTLCGDRKIVRFEENAVVTADSNGQEHVYEGDTMVLALGVRPDDKLLNELRCMYAEGVYAVGDCVSSGRLLAHANQDAFHASIRIR